jgi:drug/metabolite transporter (DMT)-like permease
MRELYTWLCIIITAVAAGAGDVLLAMAMRRMGDLGDLRRARGLGHVIASVLSSGTFFSGVFFMAIAFFVNLVGLSWGDLSVVGPASAALTFVINALGAKFVLRENVNRRRWLATFFVTFGVLLLSNS